MSAMETLKQDHAKQWCYALGYHARGDMQVSFADGTLVYLPEILQAYTKHLEERLNHVTEIALENWNRNPNPVFIEMQKGIK